MKGNLSCAQAVKVLNRIFEREPVENVTTPFFSDVGFDYWAIGEIEAAATERTIQKEN